MANVRNSNTFYIDTQYSGASDELAIKNIKVVDVTICATAANGRVVLSDSSGDKKLDLRVATSGDSKHFRFHESQIVFPNGIRPVTLTNAVVTCVIQESRN